MTHISLAFREGTDQSNKIGNCAAKNGCKVTVPFLLSQYKITVDIGEIQQIFGTNSIIQFSHRAVIKINSPFHYTIILTVTQLHDLT